MSFKNRFWKDPENEKFSRFVGVFIDLFALAVFSATVLLFCNSITKAEGPELACQAKVSLSIRTGIPNPSFVIQDPKELGTLLEALRASFALPYLGPGDKVYQEGHRADLVDLYMIDISFSNCIGWPTEVEIWRGLIVLYKEKQDGGWEKEMYLADTQGIERKLVAKGWKLGAFSDWDIKAVPENLRPEEWKDPGNY